MRCLGLPKALFNHSAATAMFCGLLSAFHAPLQADDNGVLTDKKSLLQAPVAELRLTSLKAALVAADPKQVAQFFHFPLNVMTKTDAGELKLVQIATAAEFIQRYQQLLSPLQQQFLRCVTPAQLTFDGFDYSAFAGQFWLRDFSHNGKRDFYISTLSQDSALIAPWLSANCQNSGHTANHNDELGVIAETAVVTPQPVIVGNTDVAAEPLATKSPSLRNFRGQSPQHRIEITELSAGKWRYQSWLLTQTSVEPALEIVGAKVLAEQAPILQFSRGKYRYRFIGPQVEVSTSAPANAVTSRLEIYYNDRLLRTEIINAQ